MKKFSEEDVRSLANAWLELETNGLCELGIICDLCDCFMSRESIKKDTETRMNEAREYLNGRQ